MTTRKSIHDTAVEILSQPSSVKLNGNARIDASVVIRLDSELSGKSLKVTAMSRLNSRMEPPLTAEERDVVVAKVIEGATVIRKLERDERLAQAPEGSNYPDSIYELNDDGIAIDLNHPGVCNYILENLHTVSFNDTLYVYCNDGVYREDDHEVSGMVIDMLHSRSLQQKETGVVNDITLGLKGMNKYSDFPFDMRGGVFLVDNGAVSISGNVVTLLPHSHEHMKTIKLPIKYDADTPTQPVLDVFGEWVDEDDVKILVQIFAQPIYQYTLRTTLKHNYLLQGETDAAKSTFMNLVTRFFGMDYVADVPLQDICSHVRFLTARLERKMINACDELKEIPLNSSGLLKKLDGKIIHEVERKGKTPYMGIVTCPHLYTCNKPPSYGDEIRYDEAWWGRWEFISFPNTFQKIGGWEDKTFTDKFMAGLLNLVITSLIKITTTSRLEITHTPDQVRERWEMMSNPLKMWINDNFEPCDEVVTYDKKKMFNHYSAYVEEKNVKITKRINSPDDFGRKIQNVDFYSDRIHVPGGKRNSNERVSVYRGKWKYRWEPTDVQLAVGFSPTVLGF